MCKDIEWRRLDPLIGATFLVSDIFNVTVNCFIIVSACSRI